MLDRSQARSALTIMRGGVGVAALAAPRLAGRLFGIDPDANPALPYIGRLFGVRDLAMAVTGGMATGPAADTAFAVGVAVDATDVVSAVLARRRGEISTATFVLGGGVAALATVLGLMALDDDEDESLDPAEGVAVGG